jgi:hypothetical protein
MFIEIDLASVPVGMALREPDDFKDFRVVITASEHAYVGVGAIRELAGSRGADPEWESGFQQMVQYARSKGWMREGSVRGHVEWRASR